jgi:hypothetical protein
MRMFMFSRLFTLDTVPYAAVIKEWRELPGSREAARDLASRGSGGLNRRVMLTVFQLGPPRRGGGHSEDQGRIHQQSFRSTDIFSSPSMPEARVFSESLPPCLFRMGERSSPTVYIFVSGIVMPFSERDGNNCGVLDDADVRRDQDHLLHVGCLVAHDIDSVVVTMGWVEEEVHLW